ncbi:solute carrier family 35, member F1/2 [Geosmithia morbida]|uniref:Solute carrier family 35, member F1/2 n=1 Tax=Geosmithia morbida TaxID=1094350 RepID=A0A9P4YXP2_9HYPO|nr:solute carrier family 35, member F1/2 [Geosmithia morbida]KAF4122924.1 solute carrier family 35, member F1/2 [Geosmithia morbida]
MNTVPESADPQGSSSADVSRFQERSSAKLSGIGATTTPASEPDENAVVDRGIHILESKSVHWYSYLTTADFWLVLALGQVLALCITATNTFSQLLSNAGTSIPAFQTIFNYVLLAIIYTVIFLVREGPRAWGSTAWSHGWQYIIMSFLDVEGNYFTVLAYRYTNILSAQLINFWAIVVVVIVSFLFLKVRYRIFQIIGIVVCCGGMGILIASDQITGGSSTGPAMVKGDMFALVGATCYGLSNTFEEWLVSRAPMYHVLSFMGIFGVIINGVQAAIFDRSAFEGATWNSDVAGWLVGYTLCLCFFYSVVPLVLRMASAGFYNISLLTANFWGVIVGIHVFDYSIHFMYPIAFVCIIFGLSAYFITGSTLGESKKPWLGENQENGFAGLGTAKLKALNAARSAQAEAETGVRQNF